MSTVTSIANDTYTLYKMASGETPSTSTAKTSSSSSKTSSSTSSASSSTSPTSSSSKSSSSSKVMTAEESASIVSNANSEREAALAKAQAEVSTLSILVGTSTTSRKKASSTTLNLFSSMFSSSSAASSTAAALNSVTTNRTTLINSYNTTQKQFQTQYDSSMSDLTNAASKVSKMDFDFSADDITTNSDGTKTYSDNLKSAISNIQNLVDKYNDALSLTSDYKSVGSRMSNLNTMFSDTTYRASTYAKYGISVDGKTGQMTVDTDKLANALATNSDGAKAALGSEGLAGKAADHAEYATRQADKVFPSMNDMLGSQLTTASAYTNPTVLTASFNSSMIGNLLDEMF